jgi:hypothetical protein
MTGELKEAQESKRMSEGEGGWQWLKLAAVCGMFGKGREK